MHTNSSRKGGAEIPEEGSNAMMPGGSDEDMHQGDLCDADLFGEMELDGEPEGETWPSQESSDSESESELFVRSDHSEEMSDNENDNGDEIDDITEEVESEDDSDDE